MDKRSIAAAHRAETRKDAATVRATASDIGWRYSTKHGVSGANDYYYGPIPANFIFILCGAFAFAAGKHTSSTEND